MLQAASSASLVVSGNGMKLHSASEAPAFDEQKDAEVIREETVEEEEKAELETGRTEMGPSKIRMVVSEEPTEPTEPSEPSEQATFRGLSSRASQIGEYLRTTQEVTALLLLADGSSREVAYNTSSWQTRELLDGRASIVGSLESINVIIARCLSSSGEPNQHSLPGSIEGGHCGDYLLFRVDDKGSAANLSLEEYERYAASNPSSNERSGSNIDAQRIRSRLRASNLVFVRSEIDRQVRAELEEVCATEREIASAKRQRFQEVVDRVVADCASSPMQDPNFDEAAAESEAEETVDHQIQTDDTDDDSRHWRVQLNEALQFVRARGRADGRRLAQQIASTFYELNAQEPSQQELADIFDGIQSELAAEAQQDLPISKAASSMAQRLAPKMSTASPTELVEYGRQIVEQDLVLRARSLLRSVLGREGDEAEMRETIKDLAVKLAEAALDARSGRDRSGSDADYNPENAADARLHRHDAREDRQHAADHFDSASGAAASEGTSVRTSATTRSRTGAAETFCVYFSESSKRSDLATAKRMFAQRNGREPTHPEQARMRRFLATQEVVDVVPVGGFESEEEKGKERKESKRSMRDMPRTPQKVLVTPVRTNKAKASAFNVYFESSKRSAEQNERIAVQWFERFSGRAPDDEELAGIRSFTQTDEAELIEQEYVVPTYSLSGAEDEDEDEDEDEAEQSAISAAKSSDVVRKQRATSYTLQFDGDNVGDEESAAQWFERFNDRQPTAEDRARIASFLGGNEEEKAKEQDEQTIDID